MAKFHGKQHYMGAWKYVLLDILYIIPIVGFIFLLIHAFNSSNENCRHYARSYFARALLFLILCLIALGIFYIVSGAEGITKLFNDFQELLKNNNMMAE